MRTTTIERMDAIVRECTIALFEAYGWPVAARESIAPPREVEVCLPFTSDRLSGRICLFGNAGTFQRSLSMGGAVQSRAAIEDWIGELSNQLVGRMKNRLTSYGLVVSLGTPCPVGEQRPSGVDVEREYAFEGEGGSLCVRLELAGEDGLELEEVALPVETLDEGDLLLF
jgi:hypothetical protein